MSIRSYPSQAHPGQAHPGQAHPTQTHPTQPRDVCRFLDRSGWSQARLAWELGVNQPRISRFLTGLKKPNPELQAALDAFFDNASREPGTLHG